MATIFGDVQYTQVMGHLTTPVEIAILKSNPVILKRSKEYKKLLERSSSQYSRGLAWISLAVEYDRIV